MKKILMIAVMMAATLTASAQMEPGTFSMMPKVGFNASDITGGKNVLDNRNGIVAGFDFEYKTSDWFGISFGANYSQQGWKYKQGGEKQENDYINVPVMAKFYVWKGLSVNTGIQAGFLTKTKGAFEKEDLRKFDLSIPFGISYEFSDFVIDARYNLGLTKINDSDYASKAYNSVIMLTLGYKIPL